MASTHKSLRSSTANKRPTTAIADGQIALNTNSASPGLFFKNSTGATIIKIGPVHVGTTAPNATPGAGGSSGNSTGEIWLDTSLTPVGVKIWNGSAFVNATPVGSTTVQGLLELATNAETQTGTDVDRAVTPAGLQSKLSDSTSTTSSSTIASSTAVKAAYDLAALALPKTGGTVTGNLEIGTTGTISFEGATANAFETTIAVVDLTADRTITLPNVTGTVVTTGDSQTVTSTMLLDGTILNHDVSPGAAIAGTKINPDFGSQTVATTGVVSHALGAAATPTVTFTGDLNTGFWSPSANAVAASTGGTERIRLDSSGRLLVGTSSTSATCNALLQTGSGTGGTLILAYGNTSPANGQDLGFISFNDSSHIYNSAIIRAARDAGTWTSGTSMPTRITFSTTADGASSPTERMRIDSGGDITIGSTAVSGGRTVFVKCPTGTRATVEFTNGTQTWNTSLKGDASQNWYMISNLSESIGVYMTPSASGWNNLSDERAKENWIDIGDAINKIKQLRAGTFTWKKDKTLPRDVGFIAQDVQNVLPEAVDSSDPENFGVRYTHVMPLLVAAIKEQQKLIETLETRLTTLEAQ